MGRYVWTAIAIGAALGLVGALEVRSAAEPEPPEPAELRTLRGVTGQRQPIKFRVDEDGRPRSFSTHVYTHCPDNEWSVDWEPADGAPVPFRVGDGRLFVRERGKLSYSGGRRGSGTLTMRARLTEHGIEGTIRSVWRFERNGEPYTVCDSGQLPFAAAVDSYERLTRLSPSGKPWSLYPDAPTVSAPRSVDRFAAQVDSCCGATYRALRGWRVRAAREVGRRPDRSEVLRAMYLRGHIAQFAQLLRLGAPPAARPLYRRWLLNFRRRLVLERQQALAMERRDFGAAARYAATLAVMKARGNAIGLRFGLITCTSNGPTGAANVR